MSVHRCVMRTILFVARVTISIASTRRTSKRRATAVSAPVRRCSSRRWCTVPPVPSCKPAASSGSVSFLQWAENGLPDSHTHKTKSAPTMERKRASGRHAFIFYNLHKVCNVAKRMSICNSKRRRRERNYSRARERYTSFVCFLQHTRYMNYFQIRQTVPKRTCMRSTSKQTGI